MTPPLPVEVTGGLEVIGGKFTKIESSGSKGVRLVVKASQTVSNLTVYEVQNTQDNRVHLAFCFKMKENMYYPVVERNSATKEACMKVVGPINKPFDDFPGMYLFRWDTNREYGSLCSVAEPSHYLSVYKGKFINLRTTPDFSFRINLSTQKNRLASRVSLPQIPCMFSFRLISDWSLVAYPDHSTFDEDSEMKNNKEIRAIL